MSEKIANYARNAETHGVSFPGMFWDSLKPFPGRGRITLRLAVACTLIVLVAYTFRMPFQDLMPFFVLFTTKEEKVTTAVSALLVLFAVTLAIAAAILVYKFTGNRAEFRVPAIALEIFIGMYLFRVLSIGPVGWIIGFVCAAAQSLVYLFPSSEEAVHQFLWLWVAIAFSITVAWLANLALFPVSPVRLLQREFVTGWYAASAATEHLIAGRPSAGVQLIRPLVESGPIRFLKLLKLSSIESRDLRGKQVELRRMILGLDKIKRLILAYASIQLNSSAAVGISSRETAILGGLKEQTRRFQRGFEAGLVPSHATIPPATETAGDIAPQLLEAENTLRDFAVEEKEPENHSQQAAPAQHKPSLFVADAFSNPQHVQFAIKVTLAGMLGYLFYTASDYYGIHTVFYTPLIIALASTGATIHKGFLRIVGCSIGGALGLICSIWVMPRFETLETFLFIVFCVHGLAAWIAAGSERISYMGLQIALAFDLGFLQGYGPPENIDPLRDRFIGIVIGICIVTTVFALIWPESAELSARERLAACLRTIAHLLHLGRANTESQNSNSQREQLELEIATHLSETNSYEEQAAFEALLYGSESSQVSRLEETSARVEDIYVACLPWLREQSAIRQTPEPIEAANAREKIINDIDRAIHDSASAIEVFSHRSQLTKRDSRLLDEKELTVREEVSSKTLKELVGAIRELQDRLERDTEPPIEDSQKQAATES
jgi:multidrug resistance protein MdtO